jgi:hypothetical protein
MIYCYFATEINVARVLRGAYADQMMRKSARGFLTLILSFSFAFVATPASANDVNLPVLDPSSGQVSPGSLNRGDTVNFSFRITDDVGCCSYVGYGIYSVAGSNVNSGNVYWNATNSPDGNRSGGDAINGTYSFSAPVPANLDPGTYYIKAQGIDLAGRYTHLEQVGSFVVNGSDTQLPVVDTSSGRFNGSTFAPGAGLTATFRITDDGGCCNWTGLGLYTSSGSNVNSGNVLWSLKNGFTRTAGSATDGTYSHSVNVPSNLANGTYYVKVQATDLAGRYTHLAQIGSITVSASKPSPTPTPTATKSSATPASSDTDLPVVNAGSGKFNASVFAPGAALTATFRITDDVGCCNWTGLGLYTVSGKNVNAGNVSWSLKNGFTRNSGSKINGVYSHSITVPSNLANGTYYVKVQATDLAGRYTHLEQIGSITVRASRAGSAPSVAGSSVAGTQSSGSASAPTVTGNSSSATASTTVGTQRNSRVRVNAQVREANVRAVQNKLSSLMFLVL